VRLSQGDFDRETRYDADPVAVAQRFAEQGANRLHLVDLDGAKTGKPCHTDVVERIVRSTSLTCELGGGIRNDVVVQHWLDAGLARVIVGTAAIKAPDWFRRVCRQHPQQIVLGVDARDGLVATQGWLETSEATVEEIVSQFSDLPLAAIIFTDIATDGMLSGPNVEAAAKLQEAVETPVVASGGVHTAADVKRLAEAGLAGCIIGRAIYENTITIEQALQAAGDDRSTTAAHRITVPRT